MKKSFKPIALFAISAVMLLFVPACEKGTEEGPDTSGVDKKLVIATVDGAPVTAADIKFELEALPDEVLMMASSQEGFGKIVENIIQKEILFQEAKKLDLNKSPEFEQRMRDLERRLLVEMLLTKEIEGSTFVTDQDALDFYNKNPERFTAPGEEGKDAEVIPFEDAKEVIKEYLLTQKQRLVFQEFLDTVVKKYKVEKNEEALAEFYSKEISSAASPTFDLPQGLISPQTTDEETAPVEAEGETSKDEPAESTE